MGGLGLLGYALLASETDEEAIQEQLHQLESAVYVREGEGLVYRRVRLQAEFTELFTADAHVEAPELGQLPRGPAGLATVGARLGQLYDTAEATFHQVRIEVGPAADTAEVSAIARLSGNRHGQGYGTDERECLLRFVLDDGEWLIASGLVTEPE